MPLWLLLAPRIADVAISRGVQEVKNLEPEENGRKFSEDVDGRTGGLRQAGGWTGGGRADKQTWGKGEADGRTGGGWADGRTARRMEADGRTSGQADESGRGANRAD